MIALDLCKMFPLSDCTVHAFVQLKKITLHFIVKPHLFDKQPYRGVYYGSNRIQSKMPMTQCY